MTNVTRKSALTTKAKPAKKAITKRSPKKAEVKVAEEKVEKAVVSEVVVPDNGSTQTEEPTMTTSTQQAEPTKAERALTIYQEVNGVRADFMKRAMAELQMSKPGASTYFQNAKTKAAGGKVKHYYKSKAKSESTVDVTDDSMENAEVFEVELKDGQIKCFLDQAELDQFKKDNAELIK